MLRSAVGFVVVVCILASAVTGVAAVDEQVIGSPELRLFTPENVLVPGTERTLSVFVSNDGRLIRGGPAQFESRVTTARGTRLETLAADGPFVVRTGTVPVGVVPDGTAGPFELVVAVDADAPPGTYRVPVRLSYAYTRIVTYDTADDGATPTYSEATANRQTTLTVRVEHRPSFAVEQVETDVSPGSRGTVTLAVENVGTRTAYDSTVELVSANPELLVATNQTATLAAGRWAPGETKRLTVDARIADTPVVRDYPLTLTVSYDDDEGIRRTSRPLTAALRPQPRDAFSVVVTESDLRVGRRGEVRGTLTNRGPRPVDAAVVELLAPASLSPTETRYPVGTLEPNESVPFEFVVDVPREAAAGPRRLEFVVAHDIARERVRSSSMSASVPVSPHRDVFDVEASEARVSVDGDTRLAVTVTNRDDEPVTDAVAHLAVTEPLESDVPDAFVGSLDPGESRTVTFALSATDDAIPSVLPAEIVVTYTDVDGRTRTADPAAVGVTVVAEDSSFPLPAFVTLAVVVVGAAVWWLRRR